MASFSAAQGREASHAEYRRGSALVSFFSASAIGPGNSAWTSNGALQRTQLRKCASEIALRNMGKFLHAARYEKALKPKHAAFPEWTKLGAISGNDAAPETDVHPKLPSRRRHFFAESCRGRRRRNAVERHLDQRGDSACRRCTRRRRKTFPLRAARLIDVNVRVHNSRHHDEVVGLVHDRASR